MYLIKRKYFTRPRCYRRGGVKGGLVVLLEVLKVFEKTPWAKNIGWEVLLVPDEEIGSIYSSPLLADIAKRNHLGLIFEPSFPDGSLVRSRKGTALFR